MERQFPKIAVSYNAPKYVGKRVPFNKYFVAKALQWWQEETGIKFTHKVLEGDETCFFLGNIWLNRSDAHCLFHELQHFVQWRRGVQVNENTGIWYRLYNAKIIPWESYYISAQEREANREAKRLTLKYKKYNERNR